MNNKIKYSVLAVAALVVVALAVAVNPARAATAYYVDCSAGSNGSGTQSSPWNTLSSVNGHTFTAGDQILFKRGTTCNGTLSPLGSGASGSPIIIDTYGSGNKPIIAGGGASNAVYLYNQQYWEIRNLEVTNTGASSANRRGVYIKLENFGTGTYYRITGLTIHNVNGDNTKDAGGSSGLHFDVVGSTTQTKFSDVVVDGNTIYTVDRSGINMSSAWWCRSSVTNTGCSGIQAYYGWGAFTIQNNTLYDIGGDGIVVQYAPNSIVQNNVVHDANERSGTANAGIWAWNADNVTFQYNEAYAMNYGNGVDSNGFDIDFGQVGTIMQYNYSHDNDGGFMLICAPYTDSNNNAIVRYNISQNDKTRVFHVGGLVKNAQVYNNTIYVGSGAGNPFMILADSWNGNPVSVYWYNNIFINNGTGVWTLAGTHTFDYNIFYGNHTSGEPSDPHKITANPLLVNPGSGGTGRGTVSGYQLQAGSPAIGAGKIISGNGGLDFWGNAVPAGCAPDIGAHQYSSTGGCPTATPSPTPDPTINYVQNPGFETGSLSPWTQWNNSVVASNAHAGTYSMQVGTASGSGEQTITGLTPNTAYVLKGWVKTSATSVTASIGVKDFGGTQISAESTSTTYTELTVNFTTGSTNTTALIFCYKSTTSGYVYCDDFSVKVASSGPTATPTNTPVNTPTSTNTPVNTPTSTNTPTNTPTKTSTPTITNTPTKTSTPTNTPTRTNTPVTTNWVSNPGFETGSLSPWTNWNNSVVNSNQHSGTYSMRVGTASGSGEQTISGLTANTTYTLKGWVKTSATSVQVNVGVKNFGGTETYQSSTSTSYTQKTITFTTGSSNTSATIYCYKPTTSGYAYCDDFTLQ